MIRQALIQLTKHKTGLSKLNKLRGGWLANLFFCGAVHVILKVLGNRIK
jgi:formate/nitrite transporter FocA (FNT family)